jgi:chemotaxis protein methyltransferase CheR
MQHGLDVALYRIEPLRRRVAACLRALGVSSVDRAHDLLVERREMVSTAVGVLLIGVTEFFRDPSVFEDLRTKVVPTLSSRTGVLRVWSAGCSSGAELYSTGMVLAQAGVLNRSVLLGTDCRAEAIARAEQAVYCASEFAQVPPILQSEQTEVVKDGWRPAAHLRERAAWRVSDLSRTVEDGPWDLILWRNVAIYLTPEAADRICERLAAALRPGGFVILGKAERPPATARLTAISRCIFRITGEAHAC